MIIYNFEPAQADLFAVEGDNIDLELCLYNPAAGSPYVPNRVRIQVRRKDGYLLKNWMSYSSPAFITISDSCIRIRDVGFNQSGFFDFDVEDTNTGGETFTVLRGQFIVRKQITR